MRDIASKKIAAKQKKDAKEDKKKYTLILKLHYRQYNLKKRKEKDWQP